MPAPQVQSFFDEQTATFSYVVFQPGQAECAVIDPVLDYDPKAGRTSTAGADAIIAFIREHGLTVDWLLETHAHADHLSAAAYIKNTLGGRLAIGQHIGTVQEVFKGIFNLEKDFRTDGSQFDHLFSDGETFRIGNMKATALHVPGHTPADMAYCIEGLGVFVGDTLFMPDVGTARCDFPGGDAARLYAGIKRLLAMPDDTRLYLCHDYPPKGRDKQCCTTVAAQRAGNIHVRDGISEADFVAMRTKRDQSLEMPVLILPAVQFNIRGCQPMPAEDNGVRYFKIPLDQL